MGRASSGRQRFGPRAAPALFARHLPHLAGRALPDQAAATRGGARAACSGERASHAGRDARARLSFGRGRSSRPLPAHAGCCPARGRAMLERVAHRAAALTMGERGPNTGAGKKRLGCERRQRLFFSASGRDRASASPETPHGLTHATTVNSSSAAVYTHSLGSLFCFSSPQTRPLFESTRRPLETRPSRR